MAKFYNCIVTRVGPSNDPYPGVVNVGLTDRNGAFSDRWFQADPTIQREVMAVALTAVASGLPVETELVAEEVGSVIARFYLNRAGMPK